MNNIKKWVESSEDTSSYMHNLKIIFSDNYVNLKYLGYLVSSYPSYKRTHLDVNSESQHIGKIGERIAIVNIKSFQTVYTYQITYGIVHLYKIIDQNDNIYIWRTSKFVSSAKEMIGRVKEHSVYNGIKQTEITSCKVIR